MAKKLPFGGKQAPPFGKKAAGESKADTARDRKMGLKEGSKRDLALDKKRK